MDADVENNVLATSCTYVTVNLFVESLYKKGSFLNAKYPSMNVFIGKKFKPERKGDWILIYGTEMEPSVRFEFYLVISLLLPYPSFMFYRGRLLFYYVGSVFHLCFCRWDLFAHVFSLGWRIYVLKRPFQVHNNLFTLVDDISWLLTWDRKVSLCRY